MTSSAGSAAATPVRTRVREAVAAAWAAAVAAGALAPIDDPALAPAVEVERPANPEFGDVATNLALKLARPLRRPPLEIAEALAAALRGGADPSLVAAADAARPGFVNLRVADATWEAVIAGILAAPGDWGRIPPVAPRRVNVEFVSANPTGPLTIGNARGAFVGDLLCRVLEAGGQQVTREYYFNDSGAQIGNLGASVIALRRGRAAARGGLPRRLRRGPRRRAAGRRAGGRRGAAARTPRTSSVAGPPRACASRSRRASSTSASTSTCGRARARSTTRAGWSARSSGSARAGTSTSRTAPCGSGRRPSATTRTGSCTARTAGRRTSPPTSATSPRSSAAGFDHLIYIWGADHHGTVARLRNAAQAMGYDRDAVQVLLYSWVRFVRDGVEVSMSKRAGEFITLDELLDEVGVDAARWFFGSRAATTGIDFDIELAKKQSAENPVYYVQYAHARIASILRKAAEAGLAPAAGVEGLLAGAPEAALARAVARFPEVVEDAVAAEETQGITAYATELATQFHAFYRDARVVDPGEPARSAGRLALALAAKITLAAALGLLGISAPESM